MAKQAAALLGEWQKDAPLKGAPRPQSRNLGAEPAAL